MNADHIDGVFASADGQEAIGELFDGVHAFADGKSITLGIPWPPSFRTKGFERRIGVPDAGRQGQETARRSLPGQAGFAGGVHGTGGSRVHQNRIEEAKV